MGKRFFGFAVAASVFAGACFLGAGSVQALTPPAPEKAEIVFSNGGRILSVSADGGDRQAITSPGPFSNELSRLGDMKPEVSPDGDRLLFTRAMPDRDGFPRVSIMVSGRDGSQARRILEKRKRVTFSSPTWMPSGKAFAVERTVDQKRGTSRSVVIAGLDGKVRRTVLRLPLHRSGSLKADLKSYREAIDIDVSPEGGHMLVTVSDGYRYDRKYLVLVEVGTGKRRVVGKNTRHGSFSPDGSSFVYVSSRGNRGETCTETDEKSCVVQGDLWVQGVDGSGSTRVTRTRAAEEVPVWSPDGNRIAFEANYNVPANGLAAEIYTIAPDGSCLALITNGAPASVEPEWVPGPGESDPLCGVEPREPVTDLATPVMPDKVRAGLRVWPGPRIGPRLISEGAGFSSIQIYSYEDCVLTSAADCAAAPEIMVSALSNCWLDGYLAEVVSDFPRSSFILKRGVMTVREVSRSTRELNVFSGDTYLTISGRKSEVTFADLDAVFAQLRPVSATVVPELLPPMYISKRLDGFLRSLDRMVKRAGSVKKVARRLEVKPREIRPFITFSKRLPMFGEVQTKNCPREEADPFGDF